ncbi:MAG: MFS transporter [Proteobacteria bacterium]|nr:MFS transporter [Pseudomonadota bacterium]HQR02542.1 MFS transporter [Rhodocyclaceae bacterium]
MDISPPPRYRRVALAACFGTFLEWYDFLTFASLSTIFGQIFFPSADPMTGLLASLATFGVGMVVRPLGAALFGSLGDRYGRRMSFIATIALMGSATFAIGLLPTHQQAGVFAPLLLVMLRLLQGLAMGGEIGGAIVYLTEHAPVRLRGTYTSVLQLMGPLGVMASSFQILLLQDRLSPQAFLDWGWRVPFLVSALLLLASLRTRMALHESPVFTELKARGNLARTPLRDCLTDPHTRLRMILLFCCISAGGSLLFFSSQVYAGVFLKTIAGMDPVQTGRLTLLATLALFPLTILAGWVSDRFGRRPVLLGGLVIGALGLLPVFAGLVRVSPLSWPTTALLLIPVFALALVTGPQTAAVAELFPARTRYSAVALPHNLAAGWIGGMSPFMVTWIGKTSGIPLMGLLYPTLLLAVGALLAWRFLPETRGVDLHE